MTTINMKEVAAFLLGEDSLDGYWFGERHPISPFWWREHLRAALSAPATAPQELAAEYERGRKAGITEVHDAMRDTPATAPEQMPLERDCICHQYLHLDAYSGGAAPEGLHGALWVVVEGVRKKYVLADQSSEPKDMPALATTPKQPRPFVPWSKEAEMLESWAAQSATAPAQPAPERKPMMDEEVIYLVRECGLDWHRGFMPLFDNDPTNRFAVLVSAVEAFHGITGGKP